MLKKAVAFMVSVVFALAPMTLIAGSQKKAGARKWDPSEKPVATTQAPQQTQHKAGDKNWDPFDKQVGKNLELNKSKSIQKRIGPGPVA